MKRFLVLAFIAATIFSACQKKDDTAPDPSKVVTTIASPTDSTVLHAGDTLHILATVTYPSELHGYEISITDTATGMELFALDEHLHDDHFAIDTSWIPAGDTARLLRLELTTEINHEGAEATKELYFRYQP